MDQRLLLDAITKETTDWTCEVQVFIVLYGDDIPKYEKLFLLFHTYLVSYAKVRDPRGYKMRAGTYEWLADRYTIVEPITDNDGLEAPLPAPEKLNALPFSAIEHQHPGAEFGKLPVYIFVVFRIKNLRVLEEKWLSNVQFEKAYNIFLFWSITCFAFCYNIWCFLFGVPLYASNVFTFVATLYLLVWRSNPKLPLQGSSSFLTP
ncbi:hypothetical protein FXO38_23707 [Capsicum annuum]|nr:hypothetical protein FXO38_23707 [Capsicum annuum]KAF3684592.1 hypothetical protein FXO37_01274 [Capsicum annuum]